jgi:flagellar M-ring protein FliF
MIAVGTILLIISGLTALALNKKETKYEYLFSDLDPEDLKIISSELQKNRDQQYIIDQNGIKVPKQDVLSLRLQLAQQGLPSRGTIGWEKFDNQDFTRTEFEQNINKLRAIQGELSRTISAIEGINSARVHIVMPQKALFREDEQEPTAAIYLRTQRGASLSKRQIKGITHLVSRSVEGLRPEKITIIDQLGKMLTEAEIDDPTSQLTREMLSYRKSIEGELARKITTLVGRIVGQERVEAKVDVDVDFTREEQTISDIDPDRVVVLSSNTTNQETSGSGLNPTGIPGSKSNVPGEQEDITASGNQANSKRNTERLNYEIAKTQKVKVMPIGDITRISAAVIVDGVQAYPADGSTPNFEPRTEEEMKKIEDLVKSAIGFKQGRDEVIVHNVLFELGPMQVQAIQEEKEESRKYISTLVISSLIALAIIFFFAFIVRPYFRWLSYDPEKKKKHIIVEEMKPDLETGSIQNVQVKDETPFEKLSPQEQILYLAKNEPVRTTEAIRILLNPHQSSAR